MSTGSISTGKRKAQRGARQAANGTAMEAAARWGLAARGAIYLLIGLLAFRIAFGGGGQEADRGGALQELAGRPFGSFLVWAVGVGLAGMALWRLSEALFGAAVPDGNKPSKRALSAVRGVVYTLIAYSVLRFASGESGSGSSDKQSQDVTARLLEMPGGQWLVGIGGLVLAGVGGYIGVSAAMRKFHEELKRARLSHRVRQVVDVLGVSGGVARGTVFAAAGCFAVVAAVDFDPDEAKGLDATLRSFAETPVGPWLLAVIAVGLGLFGLFSFALARWRKV